MEPDRSNAAVNVNVFSVTRFFLEKEEIMRSETMRSLVVTALVVALAPAVAVQAAFTDTFEPFTANATVVGQGSWYAITGTTADHANVQNAAGVAFQGVNYLDLDTITNGNGNVFPGRNVQDTLDAGTNVVSYAFRIGPRYGPTRNEAAYSFYWATGAGSTMLRTNVYEDGTISYYAPGELNAGATPKLSPDEWYLFTYTYDLVDKVNLKVVRASDNSVNLDLTWTTLEANQVSTYDLEWSSINFAGAASAYHALLDNVAITPEPTSFLMLLVAGAAPLARVWARGRR